MATEHPSPFAATQRRPGPSRLPLAWTLVVAAALIGFVVWGAVVATYKFHLERESARLEALSDLRSGQVANWLAEKVGQARFAGTSPLGELYLRWREKGDTDARDRLIGRLASFQKASGGHSILIMDDSGAVLAADPAQPLEAAPALKAAAATAIATNTPQSTSLYGANGPVPAPRIDVVSPLFLTGKPARGLVVLRLDPNEFLFPTLSHWPLPSRTASALLVQRDGDMLVGAFGRNPVPLATPHLLAAKVLRGEAPFGTAMEGLDFRGQQVLGVVRPVKGTNWFLVAKMDREEVFADARRTAAWIAAAGLLALAAIGAVAYWWREREALRYVQMAAGRQEADRQRLEELVDLRTRELAAKNLSLQRTVADLEAFGTSVSHDLRGPLRTVNGFASLLERSEGHNLSDEGRRKLGRIKAGAVTMDRMIEDILKCSRAEQVEMHFGPVDLNVVVQDVLQELGPGYPGTRIRADALPVVHADATMARQIFGNLVGNALKFSARQPQPQVDIGMLGDGPCLFVRDNGVGFDTSQAHKLFAPFQRLHGDDDYLGTGVGLSIVKRLVERHGGTIVAESVPGVQTTFTFDFGPALPARLQARGAAATG
ncbi:MAG: ATP-binding protein [Ramlibacter sp.]